VIDTFKRENMANLMKVHLYKVLPLQKTPDLVVPLQAALNMPLDQRLRQISQHEIRLEEIYAPHTKQNSSSFWLMDFTIFRFEHGPGKASRKQPIEGFDLQNDEGFGEETAVLFDPKTGYLVVQYNHHGARVGSIAAYLSDFRSGQGDAYEFNPKLDESAETKYAQKTIFKKVNFKIAPLHISPALRQGDVSLSRALEVSAPFDAQHCEITISSGKSPNSFLTFSTVNRIVDALKRLVQEDEKIAINSPNAPRAVETFKVHGKNSVDDVTEEIDMLLPKVSVNIDGIVLGSDLRYTRESRMQALVRAHRGWKHLLI
jgi:hypothetical protein